MADPLGVAEDGDPGRPLDRSDQLARAAGDHEVDRGVQLEQLVDRRASLDASHRRRVEARGAERVLEAAHQGGVAVERLASALEERPVAAPQRESPDLDHGVGAALEDHQQHAQRAPDLLEDQSGLELGVAQARA